MWRSGVTSPAFRQPWMPCSVVPLDKGGCKARPIVLQEALLKLATGTAVSVVARGLERTLLPEQHGAGGEGGAARMTWQLRAAMASAPNDAFVGIDCRNAFGSMSRAAVVAEADECCPGLSGMFRSLWDGVSPVLVVDGPGGASTLHEVTDGLTQGGCDAQPGFCLGLRRVLRRTDARCRADGISIHAWAYVHDVVIQVDPHHAAQMVAHFDAECATASLERRPDKGHWYVPAGMCDPECIPSAVGEHSPDGLPVLGTVADGAFATVVGAPSEAAQHAAQQPALDRLKAAETLASRIHDLIRTPHRDPQGPCGVASHRRCP